MPALARAWLSRFEEELLGFFVPIDRQNQEQNPMVGNLGDDPGVFTKCLGLVEHGELMPLGVSNHKELSASKTVNVSIPQG